MSLFTALFGAKNPLEKLHKAVTRGAWSEAIALSADVDRGKLTTEEIQDLEKLLARAGDALAELNLTEAEACLRSGDLSRAREHLQLALQHGRSETLLAKARTLSAVPVPEAASPAASECGGGCCPSATPSPAAAVNHDDFDPHTRLELLLASYPKDVVQRYLSLDEQMITAILAAHGDEEIAGALALLEKIPQEQRDDLYWFERGALAARHGHAAEARLEFEQALAINPGHDLARESLIDLLLSTKDDGAAQSYLECDAARRIPGGYYASRLGIILFRQGQRAEALQSFSAAIAAGCRDEFILDWAARLHEEDGNLDQAEQVLLLIPSGGCGSAGSLALAEFRLRQRRALNKALETFQAHARHDSGNPYWALRLGQIYLLTNRSKEGRSLLEAFLAASTEEHLRAEALAALGGS